ncbi:immunoglobulin-like domain-containing protein [Listeria booriae]|uniref:immunoglobulin-like domain-containing protein n=1 Tax=Listeria booriae TaxID=1552123 RepID=UPI0016256B5E|nr:immunoglobulin-like domain-containing protein [Listeria booriae]MBC2164364.1 DUF5011 domain-containing protein [Listeria booriae]
MYKKNGKIIVSLFIFTLLLLLILGRNILADTHDKNYAVAAENESATFFENASVNSHFIHIYPFKISTTQSIQGVVDSHVNQVAIEINGVEAETRVWPKNGIFSYYAKKIINDASDEVYMKAYNRYGILLDRKKVVLQVAEGKLNVHNNIWNYNTGGALLVEKEGDVTSFQIKVNGEFKNQYGNLYFNKRPMRNYFFRGILMEMKSNGTWSGKGKDIKVELVGYDDNLKVITSTPITIVGDGESAWEKGSTVKQMLTTTENANLENFTYTPKQVSGDIPVTALNFPDEKFRNYILNQITFGKTTLTQETIDKITELNIPKLGLENLKGIEYFTNLQSINCSYNNINALDFSSNPDLTFINCSNNNLSKLNLKSNQRLSQLNCYNNNLSNLDISKNEELVYLYCYNNKLTELDMTRNSKLVEVSCQENYLKNLNVSQNIALEKLWIFDNNISSINIQHNVNLTEFYCKNNNLSELDITKNKSLQYITFYGNSIPRIDIGSNTVLSEIACSPQYLNAATKKIAANQWEVDVRSISNTKVVQMLDANWKFNQNTGLATYTGTNPPQSVLIRYNIRQKGVNGATADFPMMSVVNLTNKDSENGKPIITANDQILEIGDIFDPLAGVSATDAEDGNLISKVIVTSNVDTTKAGNYSVTYTVSDKDNNVTEKIISVRVDSSGLTTNAFTIGSDNYVTGTFRGDVAKVTLEINGTLLPRISVTNNSIQYYANGKIKSVSDNVYIVSYNAAGEELKKSKVIVIRQPTGKLMTNPFYFGTDNYVTGSYQGADIIKVELCVNGVTQQRINVTNGAIKYYAKNVIIKSTDVVTLVGYNVDGLVVDTKIVPITQLEGNLQATPFLLHTDNYIKGTYTGDIARISLVTNGVKNSTIPVSSNGTFQYYAKTLLKNMTDTVILIGYDLAGNEISRIPVQINTTATTKGTITPNVFKIGTDAYVDGTYTGDISRLELEINGIKQTRIPASGNTIHYYAKSLITSISDLVKIHAYDATGKLLDSKHVTITSATGTVKVTSVKAQDTYLHGVATGDITKIILNINGTSTISPAIVQTDTTFKYYIKNLGLKISDNVRIIGLDNKGVEVDSTKVLITE